jgi:hypothetical protein
MPEFYFEVHFAEQHVDGMYPGEVEVEQMADELLACAYLCPSKLGVGFRAKSFKAIIALALCFKDLNDIDQLVMS